MWTIFTLLACFMLIFSRGMDLRGRTMCLIFASMSFIVGITPHTYTWVAQNGTLVFGSTITPEFQPPNLDSPTGGGTGSLFLVSAILIIISSVFLVEWVMLDRRASKEED